MFFRLVGNDVTNKGYLKYTSVKFHTNRNFNVKQKLFYTQNTSARSEILLNIKKKFKRTIQKI